MPTTYAIPNGRTVFDATLWTGTGASLSVSNANNGTVGFKPDLVWIKCRNQAGYGHELFDSVRGTTNYLITSSTGGESTAATSLTSFNSNGFTVGSWGFINASSDTEVAWQWQAGQGTNTSNTSGSITSTVSVNQTAGFSIVTYTGTGANATVGHGLGVAPSMIVTKVRSTTNGWVSWHTSLGGANKYIVLSNTNDVQTDTTVWNNTLPTSSVFSLGASTNTNVSSATYVAYCWAAIAGFSAFGSYTGNGSADGPFVYTGFRPRYIMVKRTDAASAGYDWFIFDTARDSYNVCTLELEANLASAENDYSSTSFDIVSNGFKARNTGTGINASGGTYIYLSFAENPFKYANAR